MWRNRVIQRRFGKMKAVNRVGKLTDEAKLAGMMLAFMGIKFDWDKLFDPDFVEKIMKITRSSKCMNLQHGIK